MFSSGFLPENKAGFFLLLFLKMPVTQKHANFFLRRQELCNTVLGWAEEEKEEERAAAENGKTDLCSSFFDSTITSQCFKRELCCFRIVILLIALPSKDPIGTALFSSAQRKMNE